MENMVVEATSINSLLYPKLTNYIPVKPTTKQIAFLLLNCMDALYGGAAGGGKTYALLMAALQYVDYPDYNALIIRDTYKNLSMPESVMDVAHQWLNSTDASWSEEKKTWNFPSGARLSFGYLDGPRDHFNYQSSAFHFIGVDECPNIREHQVLYMFSRLRKRDGNPIPLRFRCGSNPPTREQLERGEWVKRRYVDPKTKDPNSIFIPARLGDNPYINEGEYVKSLNFLDPVTRQQLLCGDWNISAESNFFERHWFEIVDSAPKTNSVVRYWDMAATEKKSSNDPAHTAGVKMSMKNGVYYIENIIRFRGEPFQVEKTVKQAATMDGAEVHIWQEQEPGSAGKTVIDHYRRHVLPGYVYRPDKVSGSKTSRAAPFATQCEAGNVKLVRGNWINDFLEEAVMFPGGKYKDQIDAASGAFGKLANNNNLRIRFL